MPFGAGPPGLTHRRYERPLAERRLPDGLNNRSSGEGLALAAVVLPSRRRVPLRRRRGAYLLTRRNRTPSSAGLEETANWDDTSGSDVDTLEPGYVPAEPVISLYSSRPHEIPHADETRFLAVQQRFEHCSVRGHLYSPQPVRKRPAVGSHFEQLPRSRVAESFRRAEGGHNVALPERSRPATGPWRPSTGGWSSPRNRRAVRSTGSGGPRSSRAQAATPWETATTPPRRDGSCKCWDVAAAVATAGAIDRVPGSDGVIRNREDLTRLGFMEHQMEAVPAADVPEGGLIGWNTLGPVPDDECPGDEATSCLVDLLMRDNQKASKFGVLQLPALLDQAEHFGLSRHDLQHECKHRVPVQSYRRDEARCGPPGRALIRLEGLLVRRDVAAMGDNCGTHTDKNRTAGRYGPRRPDGCAHQGP